MSSDDLRTSGSTSEPPASFTPLRRAPRWKRVAVLVIGPFLWVLALCVVAVVVVRVDVIGLGLAIAAVSFCLALVWQIVGRELRVRQESD